MPTLNSKFYQKDNKEPANEKYYFLMNRFKDKHYTLESFDAEIFVVCPECSKRAVVTREGPRYASKYSIKCPNCMFSQTGRKESFQLELRCNCSNCNSKIEVNIPNINKPKESITVKCKTCGISQDYKPRNIRIEWIYEYNGLPTEPYYQLPLWLFENVKGNSLWAYNYAHLDYLKSYISADLRERDDRKFWTLVEKLPEWMQSAKNRESVLKGIGKLEKK